MSKERTDHHVEVHRIGVNNSLLNEPTEEPRKVKWEFHSEPRLFSIRGQSVLFPISTAVVATGALKSHFILASLLLTNGALTFTSFQSNEPFPVRVL